MKIMFSHLNPTLRGLIRSVTEAAHGRGFSAYLVGGFVRDLFLSRPNTDVDIVIKGDALGVAGDVAREIGVRPVVHDRFGTASMVLAPGICLDLATARKERYPYPGSVPVVSPGTLQEDLFRRDFTVNAMAIRLEGDDHGELVDFYGGLKDLRAGRIRILHEKSFEDDPTRILRAGRFEQRFNFRIEEGTIKLLKASLRAQAEKTVKPARYFDAFRKVLEERCAGACLLRMAKLGALDFMQKNFSIDAHLLRHVEAGIRILEKNKFYRDGDWSLVYLVALMAKVAPKAMEDLGARFQLTRREQDAVLAREKAAEAQRQLRKPRLKPSQVYVILSGLPEAVVYFLRVKNSGRVMGRRIDHFLRTSRHIKTCLTGEDLAILGISAGPRVGEILKQLCLKKMDGEIRTKAQEIAFVKKYGSPRYACSPRLPAGRDSRGEPLA